MIENNLDKIVKSSDSEFNLLVHNIIRETHIHHKWIDDRIEQLRAKPADPQRTKAFNRDESSPQDEPRCKVAPETEWLVNRTASYYGNSMKRKRPPVSRRAFSLIGPSE